MADRPTAPEQQDSEQQERQCGQEIHHHGQGQDAAARACLWQAYQTGQRARFTTTTFTIEGDPITFDVRVVAPRRIAVTIDSADKWGTRGIFHHTCTTLAQRPYPDPHPTNVGFVLGSCGASGGFVSGDGELFIP